MSKTKQCVQYLGFLMLSLILSGCMATPMALIFNDPLNTDPEVFRFAVTEETPLPLKNKGATLTLGYEVTRASEGLNQDVKATFTFEANDRPPTGERLKSEKNVTIYRLNPTDAKTLKNWQTRIKKHRQAGGEGKGSIKLALNHGCRTHDLPQGPLYVGIYAKTEADRDFFLVTPRFDLRSFEWNAGGQQRSLADLPPCNEAGD